MTMCTLMSILAAALFGAAIGVFAVLVIGIHRDDRAKTLTRLPNSTIETATRRVLGVGVRNSYIDDGKEA